MCNCEMLHTIPGLEKGEVMRPAYAIEYDYIKSGQINLTLETKLFQAFFLQDKSMERPVMKRLQDKD